MVRKDMFYLKLNVINIIKTFVVQYFKCFVHSLVGLGMPAKKQKKLCPCTLRVTPFYCKSNNQKQIKLLTFVFFNMVEKIVLSNIKSNLICQQILFYLQGGFI